MRRALLLAAVLSLATPCARSADDSPPLSITLADKSVRVGSDIVLRLKFENRGRDEVTLPALRLARDAVTLTVAGPESGLTRTMITRLYGSFESQDDGVEFRERPTRRVRVPAGKSIAADIRLPALVTGDLTLSVALGQPGPTRLRAESVTVKVTAARTASVPTAVVVTSRGEITLRIDPLTDYGAAAQFWALARSGFYDGLPVHRVIPGRLAQTGDPRGNGTGDAGWFVPGAGSATKFAVGDVGLARGAHRDSASSQWFVVLADDGPKGKFARVATVISGLDVARALRAGDIPDRVKAIRGEVR